MTSILEIKNYKPPKPDAEDKQIQTEAVVVRDNTVVTESDSDSEVEQLDQSNRELSMVSMETLHLVPTRPTSADSQLLPLLSNRPTSKPDQKNTSLPTPPKEKIIAKSASKVRLDSAEPKNVQSIEIRQTLTKSTAAQTDPATPGEEKLQDEKSKKKTKTKPGSSKSKRAKDKHESRPETVPPAQAQVITSREQLLRKAEVLPEASQAGQTLLVRCYNKLLWFAAELEERFNVRIMDGTTNERQRLDNNVNGPVDNGSIENLMHQITSAFEERKAISSAQKNVQSVNKAVPTNDTNRLERRKMAPRTANNQVTTPDVVSTTKSPQKKDYGALRRVNTVQGMTSPTNKSVVTTSSVITRKGTLRSKSSVELSLDNLMHTEQTRPPNNSPTGEHIDHHIPHEVHPQRISSANKVSEEVFDEMMIEKKSHDQRLRQTNMLRDHTNLPAQSDSMVTVTSETFSISGVFPEHPIIEKMNSYHDTLTDQLIKEKELQHEDEDDNYEGDNDDVFDGVVQIESPVEKENSEDKLQISNFARVWAKSIRRSQYRSQIFNGLNELTMIESRRDKIMSNFEHALNKLRRDVRYNIRRATRDLRIQLLKKFEPELHKLYITGKGHPNAKRTGPKEAFRIGRIRSPGRLRDRRRTRDFVDIDSMPLSMTGSGCQLNRTNVPESKYILPSLIPRAPENTEQPMVPRILEMDLKRETVEQLRASTMPL